MDKLRMVGGTPLQGEVIIAGAKNAALPILCACLLTDQPVVLRNVPDLQDVRTMLKLLQEIGVTIQFPNPKDRSHLVLTTGVVSVKIKRDDTEGKPERAQGHRRARDADVPV